MPITFLLIDDDEDDHEIFCEAVSQIDDTIQCNVAAGGQEALDLLTSENSPRPDFIFLDLNMPRMNGKQCLMHLKRNKMLADIPVIIYSTSKLEKDVAEVKLLGAVCFLTKPSKHVDLIHAIRLILEKDWDSLEHVGNARRRY